MFELVLQVLAYSGVGLVVLVVGFIVLDLLTPGKLGQLVMVPDQDELPIGPSGEFEEPGELTGADHAGFVHHEHCAGG